MTQSKPNAAKHNQAAPTEEPLTAFLRQHAGDGLVLPIEQISSLLAKPLPQRALRESWWKAQPAKRPRDRRAWHLAGFRATLLADRSRVRFDRFARAAGSWETEGYGRWIYGEGGGRPRYTAIDPAGQTFRCTCGKPDCTRAKLRPFREHVAELYRVLGACGYGSGALPNSWDSVRFALRLAASITDVEADTGYVEDPLVFALCEPTIDYENADSEMASKYVAGASIFNFLWIAYEAAVAATAPHELRGLLNDGRLGERGRRLFEAHTELDGRLAGLSDLIGLGAYYCEAGGLFDTRLRGMRERYPARTLASAAELVREFRNFVYHGEDAVPAHPEWSGDARETHARLRRFYAMGRLILYLIQALACLSASEATVEYGCDDIGEPAEVAARGLFVTLQFDEAT